MGNVDIIDVPRKSEVKGIEIGELIDHLQGAAVIDNILNTLSRTGRAWSRISDSTFRHPFDFGGLVHMAFVCVSEPRGPLLLIAN